MYRIRIGLALDALGRPVREALGLARDLGVEGVEVAAAGELGPENLSQTGRRELRRLVERLGLGLLALDARLTDCLVSDPQRTEETVARTLPGIRLAADLRAPAVVTHLGVVGSDVEAPAWRAAREGLAQLADAADRAGVILAVVTGPTGSQDLAALLAAAGGLGAAYHPALLRRAGHDPLAAVDHLASSLAHAYAADLPMPGAASPPTRSALDWANILAALAGVDYAGPIVIPRQRAPTSPEEISRAVAFLRSGGR